MSRFSLRLKELRTSSGLSQAAFAEKIGVSKSSINMYERGEREPGIETLEAFADYFNVDMDYLIGKADVPNRYAQQMAETKKAPPMTDEAKELLELYNELNPEGQRQVTDYADTLVKSGKYPRASRGKKVV